MTDEFRPLWRVLLGLEKNKTKQLTCADCFAVLEYLAEAISSAGKRRASLLQKAQQHLKSCPGCRAYFLEKLVELEEQSKR